jgi:hypothetical protein
VPLSFSLEIIQRWRLQELNDVLSKFEDDIRSSITHNNIMYANDYKNILLRTAGKTIVTTREILVLCSSGYPDGAMILARNLYEQYILLCFFQLQMHHANQDEFRKIIEDYYLSSRLKDLEGRKYEKEYVLQEEYNELEAELK